MIIMFPCKKIFLAKFVDVSGLISLKKEIALKKDIVVPLPVLIIRSVALSVKNFPELLGTHCLVFRNVPVPVIAVEDKGVIRDFENTGIFSLYQWYEETAKTENKASLLDKIGLIINPSKAALKFGTVQISFPGRAGVDIAPVGGYSSLCFGVGTATPLWVDFDGEKETRRWWSWITLSAPSCLDFKQLGKLLQTVGNRIQEAEFPEINGEIE